MDVTSSFRAPGQTALAVLAVAAGSFSLMMGVQASSLAWLWPATFLLVWAVAATPNARQSVELMITGPALHILPLLMLLSVLWSDVPMTTLRASVQYAATALIGVLAARLLSPRVFLVCLLPGLVLSTLLSLLFGRYVVDGLAGDMAFAGIFGSKNSFAFFLSLEATVALAVLIDRRQTLPFRVLAIAGLLLALPCLILARSAGALVTLLVASGTLLATLAIARAQAIDRAILGGGLMVVALPVVMVIGLLGVNGTLGDVVRSLVEDVLNKDITLTGRTVLWEYAAPIVEREPLLGLGYYSFWQQGKPDAEALWRMFRIQARMGFHFHNTYIEAAVALGLVGALVLAIQVLRTLQQAIMVTWRYPEPATAALVAIMVLLVCRSFLEVDMLHPFGIGTFLFFSIMAYSFDFAAGRYQDRMDEARVALPAGVPLR